MTSVLHKCTCTSNLDCQVHAWLPTLWLRMHARMCTQTHRHTSSSSLSLKLLRTFQQISSLAAAVAAISPTCSGSCLRSLRRPSRRHTSSAQFHDNNRGLVMLLQRRKHAMGEKSCVALAFSKSFDIQHQACSKYAHTVSKPSSLERCD